MGPWCWRKDPAEMAGQGSVGGLGPAQGLARGSACGLCSCKQPVEKAQEGFGLGDGISG